LKDSAKVIPFSESTRQNVIFFSKKQQHPPSHQHERHQCQPYAAHDTDEHLIHGVHPFQDMQLTTPSEPAMAVSTAMRTLRSCFQSTFSIPF